MLRKLAVPLALTALTLASIATGRAQSSPAYGPPISLHAAKKAADAALAEAGRARLPPYAVAIVDPAGELVLFERADNTQYGSLQIAIDMARSAARFRRPTKVFEDAVTAGRVALMALHGAFPLEGGVPLIVDGQVVGAIGASGGTASQDGQVARAGANTLHEPPPGRRP